MAHALQITIVLAFGLYGFWATEADYRRSRQDSWPTRQQQQRERASRFKKRFGNGAGVWTIVFSIFFILLILLMGLAPVAALCAFPKGSPLGLVSAIGMLLWVSHVVRWLVQRYL